MKIGWKRTVAGLAVVIGVVALSWLLLLQVLFASSNRRWFWIAREPPYKIRVIDFSRGRAVFSVWDLEKTAGG